MSEESVNTEVAPVEGAVEQKQSDKELNFARLRQDKERAIQAADQERQERIRLQEEIEKIKAQAQKMNVQEPDDLDDDEPYVNRKGLKKVLSRLDQSIESKIDERAHAIAKRVLEEERQRNFLFQLKSEYRDFNDVVTTDTLAKLDNANPKMAAMIDRMPDGYEKGQMVYETIKTLGLHKKPEQSVKDRVEQNMRNPYYTPSTAGNAAVPMGDFTKAGMKAAYEKIKNLKEMRRA